MSFFALLSLISAFIIFFFAEFVYYQNRKNPLNKLFLWMCLLIGFWAFCEFMYRQAGDPHTAYIWMKLTFFMYFSGSFTLNFILIFTEKTKWLKKKITYSLIYVPPTIFAIVDASTHLLTPVNPIKAYWGYTWGILENNLFLDLVHGWGAIVMLLAFIFLFKYFLATTNKIKKQQAKFILLGFILPSIAGIIELIVSALNFSFPELITVSTVWFFIFIGYAMWKYELLVLDPETAAENIVSTMNESLIMLDHNGEIVIINQATSDLLGYSKDFLVDRSFEILLKKKEQKDQLLETITEQKPLKDSEMDFKDKRGRNITVTVSSSIIKDKRGETAGIVLVSHDITERKKSEEKIEKNAYELERMNKFMVGRETKIIELKNEIQKLKIKLGE